MVTNPSPERKPAARNRTPGAGAASRRGSERLPRRSKRAGPGKTPSPGATAAAPEQTPGERRPVAMTPYAIAVALLPLSWSAASWQAVPLWLVAVIGLAIGGAVFVFVDRYPRLPRSR